MLKIIVNLFKRYNNGFDKKGIHKNSTRYDERGEDKGKYNEQKYDKNGYDTLGYDREGYDREGYDREGYDKNGYNKDGFNKFEVHKNGTEYDDRGYNSKGFNKIGFNKNGTRYNEMGYDLTGFNKSGYNKRGERLEEIEPKYEYYYMHESTERLEEVRDYIYYKKEKYFIYGGMKKKSKLKYTDMPIRLEEIEHFRKYSLEIINDYFICYLNEGVYKFETWFINEYLINKFIEYIAAEFKGIYAKDSKVIYENYINNRGLTITNKKEAIDYFYDNTESIYKMKYFKDFSDYTYLYDYIMRLEKKFFEENKLNDVKFCYSCKDGLKYESGFLEFYGYNIFRNYFDTKKEDNSYNRFKDLVDRKKILVIEGKERYFAIQFHGILKRIGELPTKYTTILIDESEIPKGTIYDEKYRVKKPWVK